MSAQNDGGPAFPRAGTVNPEQYGSAWASEPQPGMPMRDWFAGQALAGQLSSCANKDNVASVKDMAGWAYVLADAMLAARKAKQ